MLATAALAAAAAAAQLLVDQAGEIVDLVLSKLAFANDGSAQQPFSGR